MAIVSCRECKQGVSNRAKSCPNCGIRAPGRSSGAAVAVFLLILLLLAVIGLGRGSNSTTNPVSSPSRTFKKIPEPDLTYVTRDGLMSNEDSVFMSEMIDFWVMHTIAARYWNCKLISDEQSNYIFREMQKFENDQENIDRIRMYGMKQSDARDVGNRIANYDHDFSESGGDFGQCNTINTEYLPAIMDFIERKKSYYDLSDYFTDSPVPAQFHLGEIAQPFDSTNDQRIHHTRSEADPTNETNNSVEGISVDSGSNGDTGEGVRPATSESANQKPTIW